MSFFGRPAAALAAVQPAPSIFEPTVVEPTPAPVQSKKAALIDQYLREKKLQEHPELLSTILRELHLHKFWKKLTNTAHYQVFEHLAANRMLNFYEASIANGFSYREERIGLVIAALTSTLSVKNKKGQINVPLLKTAMSSIPCFMHESFLHMEDLDLSVFNEEDIRVIESTVKSFSRKTPSRENVGKDAIPVYLVDSAMLWPGATDPELISFMTGGNRLDHVTSPTIKGMLSSYIAPLGYGSVSELRKCRTFGKFLTTWGAAKSWKIDIPGKLRKYEAATS